VKYISCFSGIGGLEASSPPELFCEFDAECQSVLGQLYPGVPIWPDVQTLRPPEVDVVAGGWPCQDISIAGKQVGMRGLRSSLLIDMLRVATEAGAHSVVAENVPNLLRMRSGREFAATLEAFQDRGFGYVGWRQLNARDFGLPQHRTRLLIIASKDRPVVKSLFRQIPPLPLDTTDSRKRNAAAGFYWTAGIHSINYSRGYVPTIKIGSTLGIPSPPAVHYGGIVRTVTPSEALVLQGFDLSAGLFSKASKAYKASGNAVARPIGQWVFNGLQLEVPDRDIDWISVQPTLWDDPDLPIRYPNAGIYDHGELHPIAVRATAKANNLIDFLDQNETSRLSPKASRGLLDRLARSGQPCPPELRSALVSLAV
jgi:DNA (cytosine-5)-methyltransferase 1